MEHTSNASVLPRLIAAALACVLLAGAILIAKPFSADAATYTLAASGDTSGKTDRAAFNRIAKAHKNEAVTIVFAPGKTYYVDATLHLWDNCTIHGYGATVKQVTDNRAMFINAQYVGSGVGSTLGSSVGGYSRAKNITIDGGTYIGTTTSTSSGKSFFLFMHGNNIAVKNCTIDKVSTGHHIEFAAVSNGLISNVRFRGAYRATSDATNEVIQLDATTAKSNSPSGAPWDLTPCKNITVQDCDINVSNQPRGIGTNWSAKRQSTGIKIVDNDISATTYAVYVPKSTGAVVRGNRFYKGRLETYDATSIKTSGNTQYASWAKATGQTSITKLAVSAYPATCVYTGDAKKPSATIKAGGKTLVDGKDFVVVSYANNVKKGTASMRVVGTGAAYTGIVDTTFKIAKYSDKKIVRLAGANALGTMQAIVEKGWSAKGGTVIVATNASYKDALASCGLAGLSGAPVLLTNGTSLSAQTKAELVRLKPSKVYIAGGTSAVKPAVATAIQNATGTKPIRLAGKNSVGTANKIALAGKGSWSTTAILATNATYKDALSAAPVAYAKHMPIFLTTGTTLDTATAEAMKSCGIKRVLVIGGPKAIRPAVLEEAEDAAGTAIRIYGADAIATSKAVASWGLNNGMGKATFGVATASGYKDALCGAALCGKGNAVLVLTSPSNTSGMSAIGKTIASKNKSVYVFGGTKAVNLAEELVLDKSLAGTTAYTTR